MKGRSPAGPVSRAKAGGPSAWVSTGRTTQAGARTSNRRPAAVRLPFSSRPGRDPAGTDLFGDAARGGVRPAGLQAAPDTSTRLMMLTLSVGRASSRVMRRTSSWLSSTRRIPSQSRGTAHACAAATLDTSRRVLGRFQHDLHAHLVIRKHQFAVIGLVEHTTGH
jgi:hypothetical protein